jgi:hypothetical protein
MFIDNDEWVGQPERDIRTTPGQWRALAILLRPANYRVRDLPPETQRRAFDLARQSGVDLLDFRYDPNRPKRRAAHLNPDDSKSSTQKD